MNQADIIAVQKRIGTTPDGFWGPKSIAACKAYLRRLMPVPNPWPEPSQTELTAVFGAAGEESKLISLQVEGLGIEYMGRPVKTILCHRRVGPSLKRILTAIANGPHRAILKRFAGVYNDRPMRGGSLPSLHARGAAIDLAPEENGNVTHWPLAASMPIEVMEEFAKEGWLAAGAFWGRDAMHFQATR